MRDQNKKQGDGVYISRLREISRKNRKVVMKGYGIDPGIPVIVF